MYLDILRIYMHVKSYGSRKAKTNIYMHIKSYGPRKVKANSNLGWRKYLAEKNK
jgi:hypothetical protein